MNTCGIITEYNPMHVGHAYQIKEGKNVTNADKTILVMSGNFVQRGEPAILNKHTRAEAALRSGIDLVLELPVYFSTASAEYFSHHAIKILDACGVVTHINFGSESGIIDGLEALADILYNEPIGYKVLLNDFLKEGMSYPKAREAALLKYNDNHNVINEKTLKLIETPNNILGIEYIKALKRLDSTIKPTTVKRIGSGYHDPDAYAEVPSATAVREHLRANGALSELKGKLPDASYNALEMSINKKHGPILYEDMFQMLKYRLLTEDADTIKQYQDINEGLENRILDVARNSYSYDELVEGIMTKRYTRTKIGRALLHIFLGHTEKNFKLLHKNMKPYIRVLGFNENGQHLLKAMKEHDEEMPIIANVKNAYKILDDYQRISFAADLNATMLYNHLVYSKYGTVSKNDYQQQVIMI